jgi:Protein of unknown function (DUF3352)
MMKRALLVVGLALPAFAFFSGAAAEDMPAANRWIWPQVALVVEVPDPSVLLNPLLQPELDKALLETASSQKPNLKLQQLQGIVAYLELQLGTDWRTGLRHLAGRGLTLAADPSGGSLLVVDGQDEKLLQRLHETALHFATSEATKPGRPERATSREYKGATTWTLATNECHVILGSRLLLANGAEPLERALDRRADPSSTSIASSAAYTAAQQALGKNAAAIFFLNLQTMRDDPKVKAALAEDANPLGKLLLADTKEALRNANWLAAGLYINDSKLSLRILTDGSAPAASKSVAFIAPGSAAEGLLPNLVVPNRIACLSLYRDLRAFYAAKDDLFPERTSGLVFFENMMGIFFSGIDLADGVLSETKPDVRLVLAAQRYDPALGTPAVQMPAFAAVLRLRHPEKFGETVEEAWQKALGLVNFTRGQQALPGLIIDHSTHADIKYTLSYYRPPGERDKTSLENRYNYRPSLARPGDYVILSSTDGLAKDLIDAVKKESADSLKPSATAHGVAQVDGAQLHAILAANRESLVRKNMLEKGNSRDQAEIDVGFFLTLVDCLGEGTLTMSRDHGRPQATLELELKLPTAKPSTAANEKGEKRDSNS